MTNTDKVTAFRRLHESGCLVVPNPWDVSSAKYLQRIGFKALGTTSAGLAWSQGRADGRATLDETIAHFRQLNAAVDIPLGAADFEDGFAVQPEDVAKNVTRAVETGIAGLSIEDSSGEGLFDFALAVDRIKAARAAIDKSGSGALLTARTEGFLRGQPDLAESIKRVKAYAAAGAECLFVPGLKTKEDMKAVIDAVAPVAVNINVGRNPFSVAELAALGARRVSVGSLAAAAYGEFMRVVDEVKQQGTFTRLAGAPSPDAMNKIFG